MGIKPQFTSGFDLPAEGTYLFEVDKVEFKKTDGGLLCAIRNVIQDSIEHGDSFNEQGVFDNFPIYTDFGKARLLGLGVKALGMDANKEYDDNYFDDEKIQKKLMTSLPGKKFGSKLKHKKSKKSDDMMANLTEYYTVEEYESLSNAEPKEEKKSGKKESKKEEKKSADEDNW